MTRQTALIDRVGTAGDEPDRGRAGRAFPAARVVSGTGVSFEAADWSLLLDHVSDAIFTTDPNGVITHWAASAERLFGYSASEAVGRALGNLLPTTGVRDGERELGAALASGRAWRRDGAVRRRDGREIWVGSAVDPIAIDGRLVGSICVSRDISDIHRAQVSLAQEGRFVSSVLEIIGALVLVLDPHGRIIRFNGACERVSGYDRSEVVGRALWDALIPPAEIDAARSVVAALGAGAFPCANENRWQRRTGEARLISWQNTCLTDERGAVTHVIATGIDITEARRRHEAMRGLEAVGRLLAEHGPTPEALDAVLGEMRTRMGYRFVALYLGDGSTLRLAAQRGCRAMPESLDAQVGVVGRVYRTRRAELVADVTRDLDYVAGDDGVASEIAVPLLGEDTALGVLNIESPGTDTMTDGDLQFARTIADRISVSLRRKQAQEELLNRTRLFSALSEFAAAVSAIHEPERLVSALADAVGTVVPSDTVVITTLNRTDGLYRIGAVRDLGQDAIGAIVQPGDGMMGRAITERRMILSDLHGRPASAASLPEAMPSDAICSVAVPLLGEDVVLGVIAVGRAGADSTFTSAEREIFALLGAQAALALANAHLIAEVSALAIRDGLTGLYNRRHFDAELDLAIARFKRRAEAGQLAAIMFDLDRFGDFNRHHGHLAGDAVLRQFGEILREHLRSTDIVARYGGEEFVAILEDCGLAEATRLANEVCAELEARSVCDSDGRSFATTVSAGCAVMVASDPTKEALLRKADAALFAAKEAGRNRVVAA